MAWKVAWSMLAVLTFLPPQPHQSVHKGGEQDALKLGGHRDLLGKVPQVGAVVVPQVLPIVGLNDLAMTHDHI